MAKVSSYPLTTTLANTDSLYAVVAGASGQITQGSLRNTINPFTVYADTFAGADMGAQINAAYASLPSAGGIVVVPGGNFSHSTPIVCNTAEKFVSLRGAPGGGTTLTYTGTGTSTACTLNISKAITAGHGIEDIKFVGPAQTGSTVGIQLGGLGADDGKGFAGGMLRNVHVRGFGCNILYGNNCFIVKLDNVVSNFGGVLLYQKGGAGAGATNWTVNGANTVNAGENMTCVNCTFADAHNGIGGQSLARYAVHLQVSGFTDFNFSQCSFDDAELYVDFTGGTQNNVHIVECHFENPGSETGGAYTGYPFITTLSGSTTTTLDISDTTFLQDGAGANAVPQFINLGCQLTMKGVSFGKNSGVSADTITNAVTLQDATSNNVVKFIGCSNLNAAVTNLAAYSGNGGGTFAMTGGIGIINGLGFHSFTDGGGVLKSQNFNTILDASQFTGSDIGAQVNTAYAYINTLGFKGGIITLPAGNLSYSTPIVFATDGVRVSLRGAPGDGTILTFTGGSSTTAITFNCGYQGDGASSEHAHYKGLVDITLKGNNTSTTNPEVGVFLGGTNGAAGIIIDDCKIEGFGRGLVTGSNTYFYSVQNTVIRNCGQNVYIGGTDDSATNSGEGITFLNCFIIDTANNTPTNGLMIDNSGATSVTFLGGSIDDCQVRIQQANGVSFFGTHFENPGAAAWGAYTYVVIDNNLATNVNMNGCIFWQDGTGGNIPTNIISNGGTLTLDSCWIRTLTGTTITNFAAITGSGVLTWKNFNKVGTVITNIVSGIPFISTGWTNSTGTYMTVTSGGVIVALQKYTAQTATYAVLTSDYVVDCTTGTFTATLPTAVGWTGKTYVIKNSGTGVVTVATSSAQTIDGASTVSLSAQYQNVEVVSDGANWKVIS